MLLDLYRYRRYTTAKVAGDFLVRIHPFLQTLTFVIPVVAQIVFWKAVYSGSSGSIGGYAVGDMILYLIVVTLIGDLTWAYGGHMRSEILQGEITELLLLPASYIKIKYFERLGNMVTRWMNAIILMAIVYLFFWSDIRLTADWWVYPAGLFSVAITFQLTFTWTLCITFINFWTEAYPPLIGHASKLLGGSLVPLTFLPPVFQHAADYLPFKYKIYFPASVLLGKVTFSEFVTGTCIQLAWTVALGCLAQFMWKKGVKRYAAYGG